MANRLKRLRPRKVAVRRIEREGRGAMATKRVGLCFKEWQIAILEELARAEGFEHVATFLTRDIYKLYPTLKTTHKRAVMTASRAARS